MVPSLRAEDWTTSDGKTYKEVTVVKTEPDAVTILHQTGGALVPLEKAPAEIQERYNYNPIKAKEAADRRAQEEAEEAMRLEAESMAAAAAQATTDTPTGPLPDAPVKASIAGAHYSMEELTQTIHSLAGDFSDSTHYTMGSIARGSIPLSGDHADPNHHSMTELGGS